MKSRTGKFYKYRAIGARDSQQRDRIRQIIVDCSLYYSNPSSFNDVYDCRPATIAPTAGEVRKFVQKMKRNVKRRHKDPDMKNTTDLVLHLSEAKTRTETVFSTLSSNIGIFCASAIPDSNQQWAYYADSHKGICIEISVNLEDEIFAVPVKYKKERPILDIAQFTPGGAYLEKHLSKAITTKGKDWKHEKEIRFIHFDAGTRGFNPRMLTKVIFGLGTDHESIDFVRSLVNESPANPTFAICEMNEESYKLNIKDIN